MPKLIAANFKMNGSFSFIEEWFDAFNKEDTLSNEVIVALPAPYLGMSGNGNCLLYTSPSPRDDELSRMPSSA